MESTSAWTQFIEPGYEHDGPQDLAANWSDPYHPGIQQMVPNVGLPILSRPALDALLSGQAWRGGLVASYTAEPVEELRKHGLVGRRGGLTRKGADLTQKLQDHYYGY
jgi:hypothetical protein